VQKVAWGRLTWPQSDSLANIHKTAAPPMNPGVNLAYPDVAPVVAPVSRAAVIRRVPPGLFAKRIDYGLKF